MTMMITRSGGCDGDNDGESCDGDGGGGGTSMGRRWDEISIDGAAPEK